MSDDHKDEASYAMVSPGDPLMDFAVMAKPCAWMSTFPSSSSVTSSSSSSSSSSTTSILNSPAPSSIALIQGYNIADMSPPTLMMASDSLPVELVQQMLLTTTSAKKDDTTATTTSTMTADADADTDADATSNMKVTLSCTSTRESHALQTMAKTSNNTNNSNTTDTSAFLSMHTFDALGFIPNEHDQEGYPPAISSAPIQMYCHVSELIDLNTTTNTTTTTTEEPKYMVLLVIDVVMLHKDILTKPPPPSDNNHRSILALVDAMKMKPVASMGGGRFGTMEQLHLLVRPSKDETNGTYRSEPFLPASSTRSTMEKNNNDEDLPETIVWDTHTPCPLGFNPLKAIVLPRPIGWISTYYPDETVPHVAPYSFYTSVASDMVAFSAYRPGNNEPLKDAQLDVETTRCFGVNTVTPDVTIAMNMSSAPIGRTESEFELFPKDDDDNDTSKQTITSATAATTIHAPLVQGCKVMLECSYVKTVNLPAFSVVIGKILSMKVAKSVLSQTSTTTSTNKHDDDETINKSMIVDATKLLPVTRGGYLDEYAIVDQYVV